MNRRTALYRVYFTAAPTTNYVVSASNRRKAIWVPSDCSALRLIKRRTAPLKVARIERL